MNVSTYLSYFGRGRIAIFCAIAVATAITAAVALISSPARAVPAAAPSCAAGTVVQTSNGPVCGVVASGLDEWLGIPYAAPPVGNLRWRAPQPHADWATPLEATQEESPCPQGTTTDENCLFVDVLKPADAGSGSLPVLVEIHGGGFQGGGNSTFNKTKLAAQGHMIVVGIQYRLGVLGFLAHSAFGAHAGDYGLEDQQAALKWVKNNIAAFGGDVHNVTIIGQSAGASSVCDQIASPTAAGLFQKAISMSGEYNSLLGSPTSLQPQDCKATLPTERQADAAGAAFAASVGCNQTTDVAACLRAVPVQTLLKTQGGTNSPIINGTTLTTQLRKAIARGAVNRVPTIMGVDRDENLTGAPTTADQYRALVETQYGRFASRVLALYPVGDFATPYIAYRTVAADSNTVCPALVRDRHLSRWMPVYAYEGDNTDMPPATYVDPSLPNGAYHVTELGLIMPGSFGVTTNLDPNQVVLANQLVAEFSAFAGTGNPNADNTPSWREFTTGTVMSLQPAGDSHSTSTASLAVGHNCAFWDRIAPKP